MFQTILANAICHTLDFSQRCVWLSFCIYLCNLLNNVCFIAAPTKPPAITSFGFINSTSLKVNWQPPPKSERHGNIREYRVFIAKGRCVTATALTTPRATLTTSEVKPKTEERLLFQKARLSASLCQWSSIAVDGVIENYTFITLMKWTNYSVYVDCKTVGRSGASKIWTNSTDEDSE